LCQKDTNFLLIIVGQERHVLQVLVYHNNIYKAEHSSIKEKLMNKR